MQAPEITINTLADDLRVLGPPQLTVVFQCLDVQALDEMWESINTEDLRSTVALAVDGCASDLLDIWLTHACITLA